MLTAISNTGLTLRYHCFEESIGASLYYSTYIRIYSIYTYSKPVYNDHSRDQVIVVSVDRWSFYGGVLVQLKWTIDQPTVDSIDRWSLNVSGL